MAENEDAIEETPDETVTDEEGGEVTKKSFFLSKPLMIKIGIGVIVLLLVAGAAYYFLIPEEVIPEPIETETIEQESSTEQAVTEVEDKPIDLDLGIDASETEIIPSEDLIDTETIADADKTTEDVTETVTYSPEELKKIESDIIKMHEDAAALKAENLLLKQQVTDLAAKKNASVEGENTEAVQVPNYEWDDNQYIDSYRSDADSYPSRRMPKRESTPEPKWGD